MGTQLDLQIAQPLTLKCGLTLPNRLVKAAMTEQLTDSQHLPDERLLALYRHWATGGWGLIITGNVQVDDAHLGSHHDPAFPLSLSTSALLPAFSAWARASQGGEGGEGGGGGDGGEGTSAAPNQRQQKRRHTPAIVQLNHPGRQSMRGAGSRGLFSPPLAPSAVPISLGPGLFATALRHLVFGTPRAMTRAEIDAVVSQFARAARVVAEAGFDGVEVHAAHGYLLSQFLSRRTNLRRDEYGGEDDPRARARIVVEVVRAVREATKEFDGFCVGIKLNSVDHQGGELADCLEQLRAIVEAGVDFVEVSGGTYEDPKMVLGNGGHAEEKSDRTKAREAFFLEFARVIRKEFPEVPLMVTGGFSSRAGMETAVSDGDCDLVGLGRPAVINPSLPNNVVFNPEVEDRDATLYRKKNEAPWIIKALGIRAVGAGIDSMWYTEQMHKLAKP